jgi:hypothetical protein
MRDPEQVITFGKIGWKRGKLFRGFQLEERKSVAGVKPSAPHPQAQDRTEHRELLKHLKFRDWELSLGNFFSLCLQN